MRILAIMISILIATPRYAYAEVTTYPDKPYSIVIDGYELQLKKFEKKKRVKIPKAGVFFDEFDYSLLHGELASSQARCDSRIESVKKDRDELCTFEKNGIRKRLNQQIEDLKTQNTKLLGQISEMNSTFNTKVKAYDRQLKLHYAVGSAAGVTILGLLAIAIFK